MGWGKIDDAEFKAFAQRVHDANKAQLIVRHVNGTLGKTKTLLMRNVKAATPVDTGQLRRSWHADGPHYSEGSGFTMKIENTAEHASYVEDGHRQTPGRYVPAIHKKLKASWVPGQHMLKNTIDGSADEIATYVQPALAKALAEIFGG